MKVIQNVPIKDNTITSYTKCRIAELTLVHFIIATPEICDSEIILDLSS